MTLLTPEQHACAEIDHVLAEAGWVVQTRQGMNRLAATGVAVCEFPLTSGEVDYMLLADERPIGMIEAKPAGTRLSGVEQLLTSACAVRSAPDTAMNRWSKQC